MKKKEEFGEIYVEKIAHSARNLLVKEGVIEKNTLEYDDSILNKIVDFFGGKLEINDSSDNESDKDTCDYIEKTHSDNKFFIFIKRDNTRALCMRVFHELGHAFIDIPDMKIGEKCFYDGNKASDVQAELFARAFIMPINEFEGVAKECIDNGKFNVKKIASKYNIDYADVLVRGKELNYWE